MSVTSTPLHDASVCISCGVPATVRGLDKAHVQSRARRPDLREAADNQVLMCRRCHDAMDREHKFRLVIEDGRCIKEEWRDEEMAFVPTTITTVVVDTKRGHLVPDDLVLSAAAEGSAVNDPAKGKEYLAGISAPPSAAAPGAGLGGEAATPPQVSPSPPLTKEESDEATNPEVGRGKVTGISGESVTGASALRGTAEGERRFDEDEAGDSLARIRTLTHEQRVAIAQDIKDTEWNRQWFAGDIGNLWIEQLGESAEQYLSDFGYQPESLANILRVCAAIKPAYRNGNLRFSHHVVVYDQPPEDRMRWLTECEAEQWSVSEFRRQVKGTEKKERHACPDCGAEHQVKT